MVKTVRILEILELIEGLRHRSIPILPHLFSGIQVFLSSLPRKPSILYLGNVAQCCTLFCLESGFNVFWGQLMRAALMCFDFGAVRTYLGRIRNSPPF